ncbi:hypothetical protein L227DRAFT_565720 [Lentinus tigrinus ALCF2SS1-6]|uniref:Uncharacterized protein n=1 Tax=Lentinus tigrinus ALCF2SS1-6 TaxID=1328759 RepID=A0A5C2S0T6_9APHY|nr:hypothetical protein L227DRAFT_565720 [Lentinus tigrinus ALCF2SS1-6]
MAKRHQQCREMRKNSTILIWCMETVKKMRSDMDSILVHLELAACSKYGLFAHPHNEYVNREQDFVVVEVLANITTGYEGGERNAGRAVSSVGGVMTVIPSSMASVTSLQTRPSVPREGGIFVREGQVQRRKQDTQPVVAHNKIEEIELLSGVAKSGSFGSTLRECLVVDGRRDGDRTLDTLDNGCWVPGWRTTSDWRMAGSRRDRTSLQPRTEFEVVRDLRINGLLLLGTDQVFGLEDEVGEGVLGKLTAKVALSLTLEAALRPHHRRPDCWWSGGKDCTAYLFCLKEPLVARIPRQAAQTPELLVAVMLLFLATASSSMPVQMHRASIKHAVVPPKTIRVRTTITITEAT